jgi:hypothetical protein
MSQELIAHMITNHQAAMARQEYPITHAAICKVLRDLASAAITEGQALRMLTMIMARIDDPARQGLYRQTIAELRQMQADEH